MGGQCQVIFRFILPVALGTVLAEQHSEDVGGCFGMFVAGAGDLGIVERVVGGWSGSVREASAVPI